MKRATTGVILLQPSIALGNCKRWVSDERQMKIAIGRIFREGLFGVYASERLARFNAEPTTDRSAGDAVSAMNHDDAASN